MALLLEDATGNVSGKKMLTKRNWVDTFETKSKKRFDAKNLFVAT